TRRGDFLCTEGDFTVPAGGDITVTAALAVYRFGERCRDGACTLQPFRVPKRKFLDTGIPYLDLAANRWLPVQIFHSRLWGRCGFWQPGGAYGFRDQLQDAMAAAYLHPDTLKAQLYRGAAHQYEAGDVQHWWHPLPPSDPEHFHKGIRSRCSDDYLWLPLACAHYIRLTGDRSVLDREIAYLESEPLRSGEQERYEEPRRTRCRESLYMHCVRALEHGFRFGAHGLPLMGCGDWNDGMNAVGTDGRGESVFCGMFLLLTLDRFLPLAEARGDAEGVRRYRSMMKHLADAVEEHAWNGVWYRRAWYDDGCVMGDPGQPEAEIDLLPQAFAAIIHAAVRLPDGGKPFSEDRVHGAMLCAYEKLFDEEHGVFSLLSPPFSGREDQPYPGYIAGYMPGLRENGGQYTHAAVWGAMGLFAVGEEEKGMRVLRAINPFYQTQTEAGLIQYQKEPYALCGDVLTAEDRIGEGGWSQYTGSAGWYFRLLIEVFGRDHLPDIASHPGE
ncbi:MAG: glycosyl transferase, partial [Clostridia bacterium]|nr:glycosyl transferase [Clostridia bacterium]